MHVHVYIVHIHIRCKFLSGRHLIVSDNKPFESVDRIHLNDRCDNTNVFYNFNEIYCTYFESFTLLLLRSFLI